MRCREKIPEAVFHMFFFLLFFFVTISIVWSWGGGMTPPAFFVIERHPDYKDEEEPLAVFTHLLHEERDHCFVCHPSVFSPETRFMTHDDFDNGMFCGKCHGRVAFPHDDDDFCEKCHVPE